MTELSLSWVTSGFADSSLEGEFRRWRLPVTRRFGYICSVLALVNFVGWWPSDISLPENERYIVFGLRLLTALTGIGTFAFLTERHGYRTCERALTIGAAIFTPERFWSSFEKVFHS